LKNTASGL